MNRIILFIFIVHLGVSLNAQDICAVWYNCENLFHPDNDSLKNDDAFTPEGDYHWTYTKYRKKINGLSKVLLSVCGWNTPAIIGLCEIENEQCVKDLVYNSALEGLKLSYVHRESPDRRGIDVALLYDAKQFEVFDADFIQVYKQEDENYRTRDILYAKGVLHATDTLHVFVNHWPSKYGGAVASEVNRLLAANALMAKVDSIRKDNPKANILAMGDFNETSNEPAMTYLKNQNLIPLEGEAGSGSHKFHGIWSQIDFFVVSGGLMQAEQGLGIKSFEIAKLPFMLEPDKSYNGEKPFRTHVGFRYNGGISDHLPLVLYLQK